MLRTRMRLFKLSNVLSRKYMFNWTGSSRHHTHHEAPMDGTSAKYLEDMYNAWLKDPKSVHLSWDSYFRNSAAGGVGYHRPPSLVSPGKSGAIETAIPSDATTFRSATSVETGLLTDYLAIQGIIHNYQTRGYLVAKVDPLDTMYTDNKTISDLKGGIPAEVLREHKISASGDTVFKLPPTTFIGGDKKELPLKEIIHRLEKTYCRHIGVECMYVPDLEHSKFLRERMETPGRSVLTKDEKLKLWERLLRSHGFEAYLAKKWSSEKRFGLEGCDVYIPAIKEIIDKSAEYGVENVMIGMAHRARLNTLVNVCRKPLYQLFMHFLGLEAIDEGAGDVKYHLGTSVDVTNHYTNKKINVTMVANSSHLEHVNPAVLGKANAEMFYKGDKEGKTVLPILVHGDSAFCGQGIVFETMQMAELPDFTCKGSVHIVLNNQVGFTTDPKYYRSSPQCTDVARIVDAPIFHVNADDPESVIRVCKIIAEWRAKYHKCVVLDLVGYRRMGHNEIDEPSFTQPLMYKKIKEIKPIFIKYSNHLIKEGVLTKEQIDIKVKEYEQILEEGLQEARTQKNIRLTDWLDSPWDGWFKGKDKYEVKSTGVKEEILAHVGKVFASGPPDASFELHKAIGRILAARENMVKNRTTDWALGEALAIGSLLNEGVHVRFCGQDVERGTFSHRHHILHHQSLPNTHYCPLRNLDPKQAKYTVSNSSLSENAVVGFQTGYAMHNPNALVIWEAQFADFANTGQAIIDTFITSGETKWVRQVGLVMLLPHGFEGMGPEHSSGRIERYLTLCDDDPDTAPKLSDTQFAIRHLHAVNIIVANCTTPGNLFHVLRRQIYLNFRKPCIVFSPKSLLRHPEAKSSFDEMAVGTHFNRVYSDNEVGAGARKLIFCSGKVYYDIKGERAKQKLDKEIALVRVEQLCPFPYDLVKAECDKYPDVKVYWAQEEHKYQGPWSFVEVRINHILDKTRKLSYIGRPTSASTAAGHKYQHDKELKNLLNDAMNI